MAAWDNVEGFEFQHDLITPSLDRQAACLSLLLDCKIISQDETIIKGLYVESQGEYKNCMMEFEPENFF